MPQKKTQMNVPPPPDYLRKLVLLVLLQLSSAAVKDFPSLLTSC